MHIAVFGATGATGRQVVEQALKAGHGVSVLARDPGRLAITDDHLRIVAGSIGQQEAVDETVRDQDAAISALGTNEKGPVSVCTEGARAILAAMNRHGVRRLLAVSAHGAADSHDQSLYALAVWLMLAPKMRDKEGMEALIRATDLDWTIVRPPALTNGSRNGTYRAGMDLKIRLTSKVSRADLADFLLREAAAGTFIRQTPKVVT